MLSDIEIAENCKLKDIRKIAEKLGLGEDSLELYGKYKAKINVKKLAPKAKLILVTAINPTASGEGKTTVSIGLADGMARLGKKVCLALREPSLGPVFGVKGGAAGGGYAQVVPMADINLHFTGDLHAITAANNLLCAMLDNHIFRGNALDIQKVYFHRCMDMNDRALRDILITCSTIIQSYHLLVMNPLGGITAGCQGMVSYNYGAGDSARVKGSIRRVQVVATAYTVVMFILTLVGSKAFASFFTPDESIQVTAARYMIIFESMIIPLSFQYTNVDMMTALGQVRFSLPLSLERKIVFFISTLLLPAITVVDAAFFAEPICDLIAGVISTAIMWKELPRILRRREQSGFRI